MAEKPSAPDLLGDLLSLFESGVMTIGVNGLPLLRIDAESKAVDVETSGVKASGIKLSKLVHLEAGGKKGVTGMLKGAESTANGLSEKGWNFTLWDKQSKILSMGKGVSGLAGHVRVNPLKLLSILKAL